MNPATSLPPWTEDVDAATATAWVEFANYRLSRGLSAFIPEGVDIGLSAVQLGSGAPFITTPPWLALLAKLLDDEVAAEDAWKAAEAAWKKDRMNVDLMRAHDLAKLRYDKAERDTAQVATLRNVREVVMALAKIAEGK